MRINSIPLKDAVDGACALAALIKESAAAPRATVAVQLALVILNGELVVVGQLFSTIDLPQGKDDDVLAAVHVNDTRVAVWLARVVDETSGVALHCCVHHVKVINAEHVATDSLKETATISVLLEHDQLPLGIQILQLQTRTVTATLLEILYHVFAEQQCVLRLLTLLS